MRIFNQAMIRELKKSKIIPQVTYGDMKIKGTDITINVSPCCSCLKKCSHPIILGEQVIPPEEGFCPDVKVVKKRGS